MRAFTLILLGLFAVQTVQSVLVPTRAYALEHDTRTLLKCGLYGTLGGAATGVLSHALGSNTRSIFVGASVGLYMGLVLGFYYVWDRDPYASLEKEKRPETDRELANRDFLDSRQLPGSQAGIVQSLPNLSFDLTVASF